MKKLPKIYCDMDGVLCDFKSYAEKIVGVLLLVDELIKDR